MHSVAESVINKGKMGGLDHDGFDLTNDTVAGPRFEEKLWRLASSS